MLGEGPPDIIWLGGALTHLELLWEHPAYRRFCEQLASFSRLILFDKRGMGLSERTRVGTLDDRMDDARAVLDATGSERAVLMGVSEGGPMSMVFAATYPERVACAPPRGRRGQGGEDGRLALGRGHAGGVRAVDGIVARALGRRARGSSYFFPTTRPERTQELVRRGCR